MAWRLTFTNTIDQSKSLGNTGERFLKAGHVFGNGIFNFFVAAVDGVAALVEGIHAFA